MIYVHVVVIWVPDSYVFFIRSLFLLLHAVLLMIITCVDSFLLNVLKPFGCSLSLSPHPLLCGYVALSTLNVHVHVALDNLLSCNILCILFFFSEGFFDVEFICM